MGLTRAEQETTIRWDEEEQIVHIWSASPKTWRKMARLAIRAERETTLQGKSLDLKRKDRTDGGRQVPQGFRRVLPGITGTSRGQTASGEAS